MSKLTDKEIAKVNAAFKMIESLPLKQRIVVGLALTLDARVCETEGFIKFANDCADVQHGTPLGNEVNEYFESIGLERLT